MNCFLMKSINGIWVSFSSVSDAGGVDHAAGKRQRGDKNPRRDAVEGDVHLQHRQRHAPSRIADISAGNSAQPGFP